MHRHLCFQLADPQLLRGAESGFEPPVDLLLAAPALDRLLADSQIPRDVRHFAPRRQ
jgi:hypothetical protein